MGANDDLAARLLAPGAPFELAEETVLGERMRVFRSRPPSLRALLLRSSELGAREYLVFGERRLTYADHARLVCGFAAALRERFGVRKGDRVAILAANRCEWIVAFWATVSLGAIAVAMNAWWAGDEILYGLEDTEPRVLVADEKRLARVAGSALRAQVVPIEEELERAARAHLEAPFPAAPLDEDDPAVILYTSGTTGRAKGATLTHRNLLGLVSIQAFHGARLLALAGAPPAPPAPPPTLLSANPLFHVSGLCAGAVTHLAFGARSVWLTGKFDAEATLRLIEREHVAGWAPHGSMAYKVIHHPRWREFDLSSVRTLGSGGAPVTAAIQEGLGQVFPHARAAMGIGYGLTEGTGLATLCYGEELARHPDSVGRPLPTVELAIRDSEGRTLPEGEEGEIWLRGPLVMLGYWRRPEETRQAIGAGRWLRTGDVGTLDEGRLTIASRKRDLILRGAENVFPAEIERRLAEHVDVVEAAVVGADSVELGQEVMAVVVLRAGARVGKEELARWVAEKLAYYKVPSRWELRGAPLPRNASGKVQKQLLVHGGQSDLLEE
jgi:acyl-CoA synthetase (AMP-forming)/AMP-acid ligase II